MIHTFRGVLSSNGSRFVQSLTLTYCSLVHNCSVPDSLYMRRCEKLMLMVNGAETVHRQSFTTLAACKER